jgi:hypothetical protein
MSDDFVRDLEEELVAAARFRAKRRSQRLRLPVRPRPRRGALAGALAAAAVLVLVAVLAALAIDAGRDDHAADRGSTPPGGLVLPLAPMLPLTSCDGTVREAPAAQELPWLALLRRDQRSDDAIASPHGDAMTWLPVRSFDPTETRRADGSLPAAVHVVPSLGVSRSGDCGGDDGPGLCLVREQVEFRCFTRSQVEGGAAFALTSEGLVVGIVPDGIERVALSAGGKLVSADVRENVYAERLGVPPGTEVRVAPQPPAAGCRHAIAPPLLDRIPVLREQPDPGHLLPHAAAVALDEWRWQLDAVVESGARFWGGGDGVEFWAVPIVPRTKRECAAATGVCIVAVPESVRADAQCVWGERNLRGSSWRLAPLLPGNAAVYGLVPVGVTGARVTIGDLSAPVEARDGVIGGTLPFPYRDNARTSVRLVRG